MVFYGFIFVFFFLKLIVSMICLSQPFLHICVSFTGHLMQLHAPTFQPLFLFKWILYLPLVNYCLLLVIIDTVGIRSISPLSAVYLSYLFCFIPLDPHWLLPILIWLNQCLACYVCFLYSVLNSCHTFLIVMSGIIILLIQQSTFRITIFLLLTHSPHIIVYLSPLQPL